MNFRLSAAEIHIPRRLREKKIRGLFNLTAQAFGSEAPCLSGLSFPEILEAFARFTSDQADRLLSGTGASEAKSRLRDAAFIFGGELRRDFGLCSRTEVMRAGRLLYRLLGIDFRGNETGAIVVQKCFFADYYSPQTCGFMSALDEGVMAGLAGGGRLEFSERITDNRSRCLARFEFPAELP